MVNELLKMRVMAVAEYLQTGHWRHSPVRFSASCR
jgi:hypothetical protein